MAENVSKLHATNPLSLAFEMQMAAIQMQNIWLSLLLGASSSSNFIEDYKKVLENCQSRGVHRNRRSYDQLNFEVFNSLPTLYLDFFNEISKLYAPEKHSVTGLKKSA